MAAVMVAAMPLQNDARPSEKTVTLRDLRRVAFGLSAAIMIVMIAGAINDDSGSSTATAELGEEQVANYVFSIDAGQSANIAENSAGSTAVMTVAVTDGPATGCSISNGNTDVSNSGGAAFAISSTCQITVNDANDLDYEDNTNSFTLSILATDSSGAAAVGSVTITVTDVNDITPTYTAGDTTPSVAEGSTAVDSSVAITDADT
ncbi:MAG: cadherin repeat domain-containing protein, partial [Candidatus Thalassarchaeaceae archaeon]